MIEGHLAQLLSAQRTHFNQLYRRARLTAPGLDGAVVSASMQRILPAVMTPVLARDPAQGATVLDALYRVSLRLLAQGLIGSEARGAQWESSWVALSQAVPHCLIEQPELVLSAQADALAHVSAQGEQAIGRWRDCMLAVAPEVEGVAQWLQAGQVAAWLAGLAHYRASALRVAAGLPAQLLTLLFAVDEHAGFAWPALLQSLQRYPWADVNALAHGEEHLDFQFCAQAGEYEGLAGVFATPPEVCVHEGRLLAFDAHWVWRIYADRYGISFQRQGPRAQWQVAAQNDTPVLTMSERQVTATIPFLHTSWASDGVSLAVTRADSHRVYFYGFDATVAANG